MKSNLNWTFFPFLFIYLLIPSPEFFPPCFEVKTQVFYLKKSLLLMRMISNPSHWQTGSNLDRNYWNDGWSLSECCHITLLTDFDQLTAVADTFTCENRWKFLFPLKLTPRSTSSTTEQMKGSSSDWIIQQVVLWLGAPLMWLLRLHTGVA